MSTALRTVAVIGMIVGLIALHLLALYLIYRVTIFVFAFVPMVGKRHKHDRWAEPKDPTGPHERQNGT